MTSWHDIYEVIIITVWLAGTDPCRVRLGEVGLGGGDKGPLDGGGGGGGGGPICHMSILRKGHVTCH